MAKFISWVKGLLRRKPAVVLDPVPVTPVTTPVQPAPAVFTPSFNNGVKMTIKRAYTPDNSTLGILYYPDGKEFLKTIELPWKDNQNNVSCIPEGTYVVKRVVTPKHGECFQVMDVPNRNMILFHVANTVKDILGCIGVGLVVGDADGDGLDDDILSSKIAYDKFMKYFVGVNEWKLVIQKA